MVALANVTGIDDVGVYSPGSDSIAKRLKLENDHEKETIIPQLFIESCRKFLEKRKDKKIIEFENNILEDECLFDDKDLAQGYCIKLELKKKLLNFEKKHEKARELENV